jgi:hypothetical protein
VGLEASDLLRDKNWVVFRVSESGQGGTDLNGDGDDSDLVLHVFDAETDTTTNLELDAANTFQIDKDRVAFIVLESGQGSTDLNSDRDTSDLVMHIFDAITETTTNVGLAVNTDVFQFDGTRLAIVVSESFQGSTDLNSDGDTSDSVLHIFDAITETTTNVGLHANNLQLDKKRLAMTVSESGQGATDLNGDADASDNVLHVVEVP